MHAVLGFREQAVRSKAKAKILNVISTEDTGTRGQEPPFTVTVHPERSAKGAKSRDVNVTTRNYPHAVPTFWMYILRCSDGALYVGQTDDLEMRMAQHATGALGGYTSERLPVELVFFEEFSSRDEALNRERQVKNWGRSKKEALIARNWSRVSLLARGER
jgi:putative endonuclease